MWVQILMLQYQVVGKIVANNPSRAIWQMQKYVWEMEKKFKKFYWMTTVVPIKKNFKYPTFAELWGILWGSSHFFIQLAFPSNSPSSRCLEWVAPFHQTWFLSVSWSEFWDPTHQSFGLRWNLKNDKRCCLTNGSARQPSNRRIMGLNPANTCWNVLKRGIKFLSRWLSRECFKRVKVLLSTCYQRKCLISLYTWYPRHVTLTSSQGNLFDI